MDESSRVDAARSHVPTSRIARALAGERCRPCRQDSLGVVGADAQALLAALPGWEIVSAETDRLVGGFDFRDFAAALAFANRVGALAEEADHHPLLVVEWGRVSVQWWTHAIGGLHRNDFIMAARTALAASPRR